MSAPIILTASLALVPCEHHIDCSGWNGAALVSFDVEITGKDGKTIRSAVELSRGSTANDARNALVVVLEGYDCRFREVGENGVVLTGTAKGGVRSVRFVPKGWAPLVTVVSVVPKKK